LKLEWYLQKISLLFFWLDGGVFDFWVCDQNPMCTKKDYCRVTKAKVVTSLTVSHHHSSILYSILILIYSIKCDPKWNSSLRRIAEASSIKRTKWTIKQQMLNWSKTSKQDLLQSGSSWGSTHSPLGSPLVPMSKELNLEMFLVNQPVIGLISSILLQSLKISIYLTNHFIYLIFQGILNDSLVQQ